MFSSNALPARTAAARRRRHPIAGRLLIAALGAMLACSAASAGEHHHRGPRHDRDHAHGRGEPGPPADALPGFYSEIGIDIVPDLEHWPGDYRPDSYRLRGYDGRDNGDHFCGGAHGATLSSAGTACPPGQKSETGTRRYSTDAD